MNNKIILVFVLLLLLVVVGKGQNLTNSAYSIYGIGMPETPAFASSSAMGGLKYGIANPININIANPASYPMLKSPIFDVGITLNSLTHFSNPKQNLGTGYLKNMALAFPVTKWWRLSFGMLPLSKVKYSVNTTLTSGGATTGTSTSSGYGSLNNIYLGNGFKLFSDSSNVLTIGFNAKYLFGSIRKERRVMPASATAFNTINIERAILKGGSFDLGMMYQRKLSKKYWVTLGANMNYQDSITTSRVGLTQTYTGSVGNETTKDIISSEEFNATSYIPVHYGFGLSLTSERVVVGIDYSFQDLSGLSIFERTGDLSTRSQLSVGVELTPKKESTTLYELVNYRFGLRNTNLGYIVNGKDLQEFALSFGFGIPLVQSKSLSRLTLGMEVGQRGNENNGQIKERFTNMYVGFTITPHMFDGWFKRRKIN